MKIVEYISDLLLQRDSVILPGFGEFKTIVKPAARTKSRKITPPTKIIAFNPGVKANDYVLAKYVSDKEHVTISQGNEMLRSFVSGLHEDLQTNKEVTLQRIGQFTIDENETMTFNPDTTFNYDTSSFGLSPVGVTATETPPLSDESQEKPRKPRKKRRWMIWVAIILIILAAAAVWGFLNQETVVTGYDRVKETVLSWLNNPQEEAMIPAPQEEPETSIAPEDVLKPAEDTVMNTGEKIEPAPAVTDQTQPPVTGITPKPVTSAKPIAEESATTGQFFIIAGCYSNIENAERMVSQLVNQGFNQASLRGQTSSGLHRVSACGFNSQSEAQQALKTALSENKLKNAWILKI